MPPITTCRVRVSYPSIFVPKAIRGGEPKYNITLMFDKGDKEQMICLEKLRDSVQGVLEEKWPDKNRRPGIPVMGHSRSCIKDGNTARNQEDILLLEENPEYEGHYIIRVNDKNKPAVMDREMEVIIDTSIIYGGCYCKVNVNAYAYDSGGNRGVTFGLNGVQFIKDGDSFGEGRPKVENMFEAESGQNDPSSYEEQPGGGKVDPFAGS